MLANSVSVTAIAVAFGLLCVYLWLARSLSAHETEFWASQSWIGLNGKRFSRMRAAITFVTHSQSIIAEGYAKFSKSNLPFAICTMDKGPVLIIPPSRLSDILDRPEDEIALREPQHEFVQASYTIRDKDIYINDFHFNVVKKQLTRNLSLLTTDIEEELAIGFKHHWGASTDWTTVRVWDSVLKIVAQAVNRVYIGVPLCRDESFLEHSRRYSTTLFGGGLVINICPLSFRPVVGPLVELAGRRHMNACRRLYRPIIKERTMENQRKLNQADYQWERPNDALQWLIEECIKTGDPKQLEPDHVAHRLLMLNTVSVHSQSFTLTNVILDICYSSPSDRVMAGIREECDRVSASSGGAWTRETVSRLFRVDSTIKESMRVSDFGVVALHRRVSAPEGIFLNELHIPEGVRLGSPIHEIHHDDSFYSNPSHFDAFRFSRPYEMSNSLTDFGIVNIKGVARDGGRVEAVTGTNTLQGTGGNVHRNVSRKLSMKQQSMVAGGATFLGFSHGRHSCPGRFFASHMMKLMVAYMVQYYDIEPLEQRPAQRVIIGIRFPPASASIRVRRKS